MYKLGNLAYIKPIIRVAPDGSIEVPAKAMGMRKGMDFYASVWSSGLMTLSRSM